MTAPRTGHHTRDLLLRVDDDSAPWEKAVWSAVACIQDMCVDRAQPTGYQTRLAQVALDSIERHLADAQRGTASASARSSASKASSSSRHR